MMLLPLSSHLSYQDGDDSRAGRGMRGTHTWTPVPEITEALDAAFYQAYAAVEPAGCKLLVALDVSGSMGWGTVGGIEGLSPREARTGYRLRSCGAGA
jgi:60 kDa SS-A/Ro ribonucleoprotein